MIKNIVFDLGNVLVDFDPPRFVMEKTANKDQQKMLMSEIFGSVAGHLVYRAECYTTNGGTS